MILQKLVVGGKLLQQQTGKKKPHLRVTISPRSSQYLI